MLINQSIKMREDIEKYLAAKFKEKFQSTPKVLFYGRFGQLRSLLENILDYLPQPQKERSIKEELYCLINVLEECQMLSRKHGLTSLPTVLSPSIFQIHKDLDRIERKLKSIAKSSKPEGLLPEEGLLSERLEASRGSSSWVDPSRVHGLESEVVTLEKMLLQPGKAFDSFNAIAIIGVSGVGKTTLAQSVYNKEEVKAHFFPRIWVSLSSQPDGDPRKAIANKLLARLGVIFVETDMIDLRGLLYALHLQLLGKRYLIVLDDMGGPWYDDDKYGTRAWFDNFNLNAGLRVEKEWGERPAYGLPKGNGGSVIVTSRSEAVANAMVGRHNVLRLQPLTDPGSCWCIFKDEVEKDGEKLSDDNIEKLKKEVEKKSAGLPLAAKVMGEIFNEERKKEGANHGEIHPQES